MQHGTPVTQVSTDERTRIGVIGGGAWGTALAIHCVKAGHASLIWAREPQVVGTPVPSLLQISSSSSKYNLHSAPGACRQYSAADAALMPALAALQRKCISSSWCSLHCHDLPWPPDVGPAMQVSSINDPAVRQNTEFLKVCIPRVAGSMSVM